MTALLRIAALRERLRSSLWFRPSVSVLVALVVGTVLAEVELRTDLAGPLTGFAGTPEGARAVLATVAGSTITVTGLTFSLTVVALQVAASQFSPRLLSAFLADRGNQAVLSTFLATFVYSLAVLRSIRSASDRTAPFVPDAAVAIGLALTLLSVAMLVYFFHHLTQQLRVESVLSEVSGHTLSLIRGLAPEDDADRPEPPAAPSGALIVRAKRSGYLQAVDPGVLLRMAEDLDVVVRLRPTIGTHITEGTTLAWVWTLDGSTALGLDDEGTLTSRVHGGIHVGLERTMQHDVAFGLRQLVDICAKAMSPGINDPTTAAAAIATMAPILALVAQQGLVSRSRTDEQGRVRVGVAQVSFSELLGLACDQPRRYGAAEPAVLLELLRLLTDVGEVASARVDHRALRAEIDRTVSAAEDAGMDPDPLARVRAAASHARAALSHGCRVSTLPEDVDTPAE